MEYRKNDLVTLKIDDFTTEGEGIGKAEGFTVFVKDTVPGDLITARLVGIKKNYAYGRLTEIIRASDHRVSPRCEISRPCGGCQLQSLSYGEQLSFKTGKVKKNLERIGGFSPESITYEPIIGMEHPWRYRNKAIYPVGRGKEGKPTAGFYAGRTHSIVACGDCRIGAQENSEIVQCVLAYMEKFHVQPYDENTGKGLIRHIQIRKSFSCKESIVCLVINGRTIPKEKELIRALSALKTVSGISLSRNEKRTNVILGDEVRLLWGKPAIRDTIEDLSFMISPQSFFQVNPVQTLQLYRKVREYCALTGRETVWDLYCGTGTISLFVAAQAKRVLGVEIVPQAVRDARENAAANHIHNVSFIEGAAEKIVPMIRSDDHLTADVVIIDPPRKGCAASLLETILEMDPSRIVYVSCDSATLARDLRFLCTEKYEIKAVCPVDMFPHTTHIETVCLLSNRKPDTKVRIDVDLEDYYRIKDSKKNQN